jgi:arylsulfatase A-like enzyme
MRLLHVLLFFVFAALCLPPGFGDVSFAETPPNLIFILADDLGYGDLGCYGQKEIKTPHLDRLAREGMRFTDFYAGSTVCAPSRCVLMTGLHTGHCIVRGNAGKQRPEIQNLRDEDITLAEVLAAAGYVSGLSGKWGLGDEGSPGLPTKQGFHHFFGYLNQHHAHNYYPAFLIRGEKREQLQNVVPGTGDFGSGVASKKVQYSADLITADALEFIRRQAQGAKQGQAQPFFLYFAPTIPHANNEAGKQGMEVPDLGEYANRDWPAPQKGHAAMISRLDADVGKLLALLKELGLDENTLVMFASDNGPHAEGGNNPAFNDSNGPLRGKKRDLTEGGIRVPLIARWPSKIKAGSESSFVGGFQDILPTFAEFAGAQKQLPPVYDGVSLVPTLLGEGMQAEHDYLYWAFYEGGAGQAIRKGKWKAIQQPYHSAVRLYDLSQDIGEETDVAAQHPDVVAELTALMNTANVPNDRWSFPTKE